MDLERWVIDEIDAGVVRVLRADIADGVTLEVEDDRLARVRDDGGAAREIAMEIEGLPTAAWTEEREWQVDVEALGAFLLEGVRRSGPPGLPARVDLREGDVYWVLAPDTGYANPHLRDFDEAEGAGPTLARFLDGGGQIWDVTAAARQAIKRLYAEALIARPSERPNPEQRPPADTSG